jgi:Cu/Ag efflux pump CusA
MSDGRDASDVVQVHLEHRLVRRLLSRFLSQGFQSKLSLGMVPMALALGEGGEQNAPLGRAVIGGLLVATVMT